MPKLTINPDGFICISTGYSGSGEDFLSKTGMMVSLPPGLRYFEFDSSTMLAFGHTTDNRQVPVSGIDLSVYADAVRNAPPMKGAVVDSTPRPPLIITADPDVAVGDNVNLPVVNVDRIQK